MVIIGIVLYLISSLLLLIEALRSLRFRRIYSVIFFSTAGYMLFAAMTVIDLVQVYGGEIYFLGALVSLVGSIILYLAVYFLSRRYLSHAVGVSGWNVVDYRQHSIRALLFAIISLLIITISRGEDITLTWSEVRGGSGFATALGTAFFMLATPGIVSAFICKRHVLGIILSAISIYLFIIIGSRAAMLCAAFFLIWIVVVSNAKITFAKIIYGLTVVGGIFFAHTLLRALRGLGIGGIGEALENGFLWDVIFPAGEDVSLLGGETDMPSALLLAVANSSIEDFGFMTSIQRIFLMPIPSIQGVVSKPLDVTNRLWEKAFQYGMFDDEQGQATLVESYVSGTFGSLHPTLFGEYYLSGGFVSLIFSILIVSCVLVGIDRYFAKSKSYISICLCGPTIAGLLFAARGNSVIGFGYFLYLGVLVILVEYVSRKWLPFLRMR